MPLVSLSSTAMESWWTQKQCGTASLRRRLANSVSLSLTRTTGVTVASGTSTCSSTWPTASGIAVPEDLFERLHDKKVAACNGDMLKAIEGAPEAVARVAETGVPMCVASNGTVEETVAKLRSADLLEYFGDRIFSGYDVAQGKPFPDLFLYASQVMGIEVSRCIVVEDSDTGVQGALSAGMRTLVLAPNGPSPLVAGSGAAVFARFADLTDELVRMCSDTRE